MSDLPNGWIEAQLGDVVDSITNGIPLTQNKEKRGIAVTRIETISDGTVDFNKLGYVDQDESEAVKYRLRTGDILFSHINSPKHLGKTALFTSAPFPIFHGTNLLLVRVRQGTAEPRFFEYELRKLRIDGIFSLNAQHAVNQASINQKKLNATVLKVAPLNEQKRIADKLDQLLARVDACRERLDRIPHILKRFRQSVLAAATSGKLTEEWRADNPGAISANSLYEAIRNAHEAAGGHKTGNAAPPTEDVHLLKVDDFPTGWSLATLRELVSPERPITYGILKPGPELNDGIPYVRVADFPNDRLNLGTIRRTSPVIDQEFKRSRLREGDLLLSIRGTVGRIVVIPAELEHANITQDSARLSIQKPVNTSFVLWYLRSEGTQARMRAATKGVAVRGINIGDVRALQVPLPSRAEQDEIVRRVEALFAYADRLEARYQAAKAKVDQLTPALLAKAFRGELVPQDPNDEPASVLLERIRAAKASQPAKAAKIGKATAGKPKGPKPKATKAKPAVAKRSTLNSAPSKPAPKTKATVPQS